MLHKYQIAKALSHAGIGKYRQKPKRKEGCARRRQKIDGVVVDPATALEGGAKKAVKQQSEDTAAPTDRQYRQHFETPPQDQGARKSYDSRRYNSRQCAAHADGAVGSRICPAKRSNHARLTAED